MNFSSVSDQGYAVYSRIGDVKRQLNLAKTYLSKEGVNEQEVTYFRDSSSAERQHKLKELLSEIRQGRIQTVITFSRDRLTRSTSEYVEIAKLFYQHNVNVVFTSSRQAPFATDFERELILFRFSELERECMAKRSRLGRRNRQETVR